MGWGVTISNPSSGGVIRSKLDASAKKAKTWSRASGRRIEVVRVWIIDSVALHGVCVRKRCGQMILVSRRCQPMTQKGGIIGRISAVGDSTMVYESFPSLGPRRVLEHHSIPIQ